MPLIPSRNRELDFEEKKNTPHLRAFAIGGGILKNLPGPAPRIRGPIGKVVDAHDCGIQVIPSAPRGVLVAPTNVVTFTKCRNVSNKNSQM